MKNCPSCGKENKDEVIFCLQCGLKLKDDIRNSVISTNNEPDVRESDILLDDTNNNSKEKNEGLSPMDKMRQASTPPPFMGYLAILSFCILIAIIIGFVTLKVNSTNAKQQNSISIKNNNVGKVNATKGSNDTVPSKTTTPTPKQSESTKASTSNQTNSATTSPQPNQSTNAATTKPTNSATTLPQTKALTKIEDPSKPTPAMVVKDNSYLLADSSKKYLKTADLEGFSENELIFARNEIFAKHGRLFNDAELQNYFNNKTWYRGIIAPGDFKEAVLNNYEKKNVEFIKYMESVNYAYSIEKSYPGISSSLKRFHTKKMAAAWDFELNRIYDMLQVKLSSSDMKALAASELEWIIYKEDQVDKVFNAGQDGNLTLSELSKQRTLLLIDYYFE